MNEMELVRQLQTGSRTAFDQIYERYHVQAYRMAVLLTGNRADAEDVVQETFVQAYLHAKELKEPAGFKSWFYRILTRLAWKCGRNGKREIPDEDIAVRADRADGGDCLSRLIGKEERERIRKAVESLDEKHRSAFLTTKPAENFSERYHTRNRRNWKIPAVKVEVAMRKDRTDERIARWFGGEADQISVPTDLKKKIDSQIDLRIDDMERSRHMKKFSTKKVILAVAAVALIGSVTVAAVGRLASSSSHSYLNNQVKDYSALAGVEEEVGFAFPSVEEFSNGFRFASALPVDSSDYDEDGNVLSSYKGVDLTYTDGTQDVSAYIYPSRSYEGETTGAPGVTPVWEGEKGGISLTVTRTVHKFVPADHEKTEEDIQAEQEGRLVFAYGSNEVEETVSYNCRFEKDGLSYELLGFDLTMEPEQLAEMAAELATMGE